MITRRLTGLAAAVAAVLAALVTGAAGADRIDGPFTFDDKLKVFVVRPNVPVPQRGPDLASVDEAVGNGALKITETGGVRRLTVQNFGDRPVFLQAGDLLFGGKQDRVVAVSTLVPPRSGPISIDVFCVEKDRWAMSLSGKSFTASGYKFPFATQLIRHGQHGIWSSVHSYQASLARALGIGVIDQSHSSSMTRTLVNASPALDGRIAKLSGIPIDGATGYVAVADGRVVAAERFGSPAMLQKAWPKLMRSAAVAGIVAPTGPGGVATSADVRSFLETAAKAGRVTDFAGPDGSLLHRAYNVAGPRQWEVGNLVMYNFSGLPRTMPAIPGLGRQWQNPVAVADGTVLRDLLRVLETGQGTYGNFAGDASTRYMDILTRFQSAAGGGLPGGLVMGSPLSGGIRIGR